MDLQPDESLFGELNMCIDFQTKITKFHHKERRLRRVYEL